MSTYDEIIKKMVKHYGCTGCKHLDETICTHSGNRCPLPMVSVCPISWKSAPTQAATREKRAFLKPYREPVALSDYDTGDDAA